MLNIINIKESDYQLIMIFSAETTKEFLTEQKIFRALISMFFCIESGFGFDSNMKEKKMFTYP